MGLSPASMRDYAERSHTLSTQRGGKYTILAYWENFQFSIHDPKTQEGSINQDSSLEFRVFTFSFV